MVEKRYKRKVVNHITDSETIQNSLIGVSISEQDLEFLKILYRKRTRDISYNEINYGFSFYIPHMIENVYQYNVKIEPRKPKRTRQFIFFEFVSKNFPSMDIAFDGVRFAYAPQRLEMNKFQCKTKIIHPKSKIEREFMVTIEEENDCEIPIKQSMRDYLNNPQSEEPTRAVQAFESTLEVDEKTRREGAMISSSFFVLPSEIHYSRMLLCICRNLWIKFQDKKSSMWQWLSDIYQQVENRIQDILAQGSSSAPDIKIIHDNLNCMTEFDILVAVEKFPKFEEITKKYFPKGHENLYIPEDMPFDRLSSYMRIFGHLIKSIRWNGWNSENQTPDEEYLKMIAEFCGKSLIQLIIEQHYLNFNVYLLSQFQVLEELQLSEVSVNEFESIPSLKKLSLVRLKFQHFDWLSQKFPKLENIGFFGVDGGMKDDMLIEFQRQNPQLQRLFFDFGQSPHRSSDITSSVLKNIATRTPNIEELIFCLTGDVEFEANTVHLSGLHKLKHLEISNDPIFSAKPLIDSLADKQIPIECLYINSCNHAMENLTKLKQLKSVRVLRCSEETLINSIKQMSTLEDISVIDLMTATVPGVLQILESIQNAKLELRMDTLSIDSNEYSSMLALAKDRHLQVILYFEDAYIDVEDDVLASNDRWLKIGNS